MPAERADRLARWLATALIAAALVPSPASGQDEIETPELPTPSLQGKGTATYDAGGARDPFVPLTVGLDPTEGPRFETLRLTGVFVGTPGTSLVVLEDPARRGHFVRLGERVGNARLVEIRPRSAVFEIEEYGAVRREILELERSKERP